MKADYYFSETAPTNNYPTHKQFIQIDEEGNLALIFNIC